VQGLFKEHYKNSMDAQFQDSVVVEMLESALSQGMNFSTTKIDADWEMSFFLQPLSLKTNTVTQPLPANLKYNNIITPYVLIIWMNDLAKTLIILNDKLGEKILISVVVHIAGRRWRNLQRR
jgi:hypothetical protein